MYARIISIHEINIMAYDLFTCMPIIYEIIVSDLPRLLENICITMANYSKKNDVCRICQGVYFHSNFIRNIRY